MHTNPLKNVKTITMDAGKKVCVIDEGWDVVSFSHPVSEFLRRGAQRNTNQPPLIITAMPDDYANANVDAASVNAVLRNAAPRIQLKRVNDEQ